MHTYKFGKPRDVTQTVTIRPYLNEVSVVDSRGITTYWHILNHCRGRAKLVFKRQEMIIQFDDDEVAALIQRFTIPECIAKALTDHADDEKPIVALPEQYVEDRAIALARELTEHRQLIIITAVDREIVKEAVEGSTLPDIINDLYQEGEYTKKEATRRMKTLERLENKLRKHGIETVGFAFTSLGE